MDVQKVAGYTMLIVCYIVFSLFAIMGIVFYDDVSPWVALVAIIAMFVLTIIGLRSAGSSDHARARQSNQTLDLASKTVTFMRQGLDADSARRYASCCCRQPRPMPSPLPTASVSWVFRASTARITCPIRPFRR